MQGVVEAGGEKPLAIRLCDDATGVQVDTRANENKLGFTELETSNRRAKPHLGRLAVFLCPKSGVMAGRLGEYNTRKGNTQGSTCCWFQPPRPP